MLSPTKMITSSSTRMIVSLVLYLSPPTRELVEAELTKHVKYCKFIHDDTSFLDLFAYRKPANLRKPQIVNFMCYHNTCGQLDKDNCLSPLNCCHKTFTVPIDGTWITTTFLCAIFFRNINVPDITHVNGFPSLLFLWNRALSFNIRI